MQGRVESLFARFRRRGDPLLLAKVFDRTAPELWRLAAHLCRDRHDAEDVVQATFLAAIESKDAWDAERPLLPWLVGLLVNRVREQRRQRRRVLDSDRIAAQATVHPAEVAAEREFGAAFATALRSVSEPFRSVLEKHLVRGMNAGDIAVDLGVPAPTVRTRLHRGLQQLRQKLPTGAVAGGLVPVCMPAESFAATRAAVLAKVPGGGAVAAGTGSVAVGVLGVWAMKKVLLGVVAASVGLASVGLAGWWVFDALIARRGPERDQPATSEPVVAAELSAQPSHREHADRVGALAPLPSERVLAATAGELSVLVRQAESQAPIAGVTLVAWVDRPTKRAAAGTEAAAGSPVVTSRDDPAPYRADGVTDDDGRVVLRLAAGPVRLVAHPGQRKPSFAVVQAGQTTEHVHDVEPWFTADVLVLDRDGSPAAGASILARGDLSQDLKEIGRTDGDGRWRNARMEVYLLVRAVRDGFAASSSARLSAESSSVVLKLGAEASTMHGVVRDEAGAALAGAVVVFVAADANVRSVPLTVRTDERGRYRCAWLEPGDYHLLVSHQVSEQDRRVMTFRGVALLGDRPPTDLWFAGAAAVVVQLRRYDGSPLMNCSFVLARKSTEIPVAFAPWCHLGCMTDGDGVGVLPWVMPGRYVLRASYYNATLQQEIELHKGERFRLDHRFGELGSLLIEVVDEQGKPRSGIGVQVRVSGNEMKRRATDAKGRVRFDKMERRDYEVSLLVTEKGFPLARHQVSTAALGRLVMPTDARLGRIAGQVVAPSGELPAKLSLTLYHYPADNSFRRESVAVTLDRESGRFACDALPAGRYQFTAITMEPFANLAVRPNIEVSADGVTDLGVIELGAGEVQVDVRARAGSGKMHAAFALPGLDYYTPGLRQPEQDGRLRLQHLAAGAYRVMVWGENVLPCFRDVIVAIDSVTAITIEQQPGVRTEVRLPGSIGTMNVHMPDGSVLREIVLNLKSWVRGLAPGSYRLEYVEFDGDRHTAEFTVGTQSGRPLNLSLRSR